MSLAERGRCLVLVVVDGDLLRIGDHRRRRRRRQSSRKLLPVPSSLSHKIHHLLPHRFLINDPFPGHLDLPQRFRLGAFEFAALFGLERFEVAFRDRVDAVLDLKERGEGEGLRVRVPGRWREERNVSACVPRANAIDPAKKKLQWIG